MIKHNVTPISGTGISVAIATHNRADELRATLHSLVRATADHRDPFEILIIANVCTDHTAAVVAEFERCRPGVFRCVDEPAPGLSHARNRAVAEARFDVIAFLDDDVDVDPGWIGAIRDVFRDGTCAAVGGRADLIYPHTRPHWLGEKHEGLLTKVDLGTERRLALPDELYGLNLSIRRSWLDRVGPFRTDLGRVGGCLLGSEESELLERIHAASGELLYEPQALVGHRVPPARLQRRWFWARAYWGRIGATRMLSRDEVSVVTTVKAAWRLGRTLPAVAAALLAPGPGSCRFFECSMKAVARWADLVGLSIRLRAEVTRHLRLGEAPS